MLSKFQISAWLLAAEAAGGLKLRTMAEVGCRSETVSQLQSILCRMNNNVLHAHCIIQNVGMFEETNPKWQRMSRECSNHTIHCATGFRLVQHIPEITR